MRAFALSAAILLLLGGCSDHPGPTTTSASQWAWSMMKSPQTGRCYEVATREAVAGTNVYSYSGMAEVPCDDKIVKSILQGQ